MYAFAFVFLPACLATHIRASFPTWTSLWPALHARAGYMSYPCAPLSLLALPAWPRKSPSSSLFSLLFSSSLTLALRLLCLVQARTAPFPRLPVLCAFVSCLLAPLPRRERTRDGETEDHREACLEGEGGQSARSGSGQANRVAREFPRWPRQPPPSHWLSHLSSLPLPPGSPPVLHRGQGFQGLRHGRMPAVQSEREVGVLPSSSCAHAPRRRARTLERV